MSYYQYYRQQPNFGTPAVRELGSETFNEADDGAWFTVQYMPGLPSQPVFQPQSAWGGPQFFRAQAGLPLDDYDE